MRRLGRYGIPGLAAAFLVALAAWRKSPSSREAVSGKASAVRPAARAVDLPPAPPGSVPAAGNPHDSVLAQILRGEVPPPSSDVISGPLTVEGSGAGDGDFPDLSLNPSQRTLVDTLLARRRAAFESIRREALSSPQTRESADLLSVRLKEAHETSLASIRDCLLPDQREAFDQVVKSGKWGGYTVVIPLRP
jgi:hypothetical protein